MAVLTNSITDNKCTELSGGTRLISMYNLAMTTATDSIVLAASTNGITAIKSVFVCMNTAPLPTCVSVGASFTGLRVDINAVAAAGTAATTYPEINLLVIGTG